MKKIVVFLFLAAFGVCCKKEELKPVALNRTRILKKVIIKSTDNTQTVTMDISYHPDGKVSEVDKVFLRTGEQDSAVKIEFHYRRDVYSSAVDIYTNSYPFYNIDETFNYDDFRSVVTSYFKNIYDYKTNTRWGKRYLFNKDYIGTIEDSTWSGNTKSLNSDSILIKRPDAFTTHLSFPPYASCIYPYVKYNKAQLEYGSGNTCGADNKIMKVTYSNLPNLFQKELWDAFSPVERIDGLFDLLVFKGESPNLPYSKTTDLMKEEYEYVVDAYGWVKKINVYQTDAGGTKTLKSVYTLFY